MALTPMQKEYLAELFLNDPDEFKKYLIKNDLSDQFAEKIKQEYQSQFELLQTHGISFDKNHGLNLEHAKEKLQTAHRDKEFLKAVVTFFPPRVINALQAKSKEATFFGNQVLLPDGSSLPQVMNKDEYLKKKRQALEKILIDVKKYLSLSQKDSSLIKTLRDGGRDTFDEAIFSIDMAQKRLDSLYKNYGLDIKHYEDLSGVIRAALREGRSNQEELIKKAEHAVIALGTAPLVGLFAWSVAPALTTAAATKIGVSSTLLQNSIYGMMTMPLLFAGGGAVLNSAVDNANFGGGFYCNLLKHLEEVGPAAINSTAMLLSIPVGSIAIGGAAGAVAGATIGGAAYFTAQVGSAGYFMLQMLGSGYQDALNTYEMFQESKKNQKDGHHALSLSYHNTAVKDAIKTSIDLGLGLFEGGNLLKAPLSLFKSKEVAAPKTKEILPKKSVKKQEVTSKKKYEISSAKISEIIKTKWIKESKFLKSKERRQSLNRLKTKYKQEKKLQELLWTLEELGDKKSAQKVKAELKKTLERGEILEIKNLEIEGIPRGAQKEKYVVSFKDGTKALFKPDPKVKDFVANSDAEVSAYLLDQKLELNMVPMTVMRTINGQRGSLQYFVDNAKPAAHFVTLERYAQKFNSDYDPAPDLKVFDFIFGNQDRHLHNYLMIPLSNKHGGGAKVVAIDSGLMFKHHPKDYYIAETGGKIPNIEGLIPQKRVYYKLKQLSDNQIRALLKDYPNIKSEGVETSIKLKNLFIKQCEEALNFKE